MSAGAERRAANGFLLGISFLMSGVGTGWLNYGLTWSGIGCADVGGLCQYGAFVRGLIDSVEKVRENLKHRIKQFVDYYNHERYHESLDNLTPADVYYGRGEKILNWRAKIKKTNVGRAASVILPTEGSIIITDEREALLNTNAPSSDYFEDVHLFGVQP